MSLSLFSFVASSSSSKCVLACASFGDLPSTYLHSRKQQCCSLDIFCRTQFTKEIRFADNCVVCVFFLYRRKQQAAIASLSCIHLVAMIMVGGFESKYCYRINANCRYVKKNVFDGDILTVTYHNNNNNKNGTKRKPNNNTHAQRLAGLLCHAHHCIAYNGSN